MLVLYWLSKYGFECAKVDHTGIDLIARNPTNDEVMGISVKSRSRNIGKGDTALSVSNDNFVKIDTACEAFNCVPYFAVVIDSDDKIRMYILKKEKLLFYAPKGKTVASWKMSQKHLDKYELDSEIIKVEFNHETKKWWT